MRHSPAFVQDLLSPYSPPPLLVFVSLQHALSSLRSEALPSQRFCDSMSVHHCSVHHPTSCARQPKALLGVFLHTLLLAVALEIPSCMPDFEKSRATSQRSAHRHTVVQHVGYYLSSALGASSLGLAGVGIIVIRIRPTLTSNSQRLSWRAIQSLGTTIQKL